MQYTKSLLPLVLISWIIIEGCKTKPITISESHIQAVFSDGSNIRIYVDSSSQPVNIGRTGGPNVYDFRNLPFYLEGSDTVFSVTEIPQLAARFSSNAVALKEPGLTAIEYPVTSFSNQKFYSEGRGRISLDTTEWYQHNMPFDEFLRFPVRFKTQFNVKNTVVIDITYVNGIASKTSSDTTSKTVYVDGYGTLLLPGGLAYDCLRLRTVLSSPQTYKSFQFWTREGAIVLVNSDKSQPDTGMVLSGYIIYLSYQKGN